jgi:hypothetical protein
VEKHPQHTLLIVLLRWKPVNKQPPPTQTNTVFYQVIQLLGKSYDLILARFVLVVRAYPPQIYCFHIQEFHIVARKGLL